MFPIAVIVSVPFSSLKPNLDGNHGTFDKAWSKARFTLAIFWTTIALVLLSLETVTLSTIGIKLMVFFKLLVQLSGFFVLGVFLPPFAFSFLGPTADDGESFLAVLEEAFSALRDSSSRASPCPFFFPRFFFFALELSTPLWTVESSLKLRIENMIKTVL